MHISHPMENLGSKIARFRTIELGKLPAGNTT